MNRYSFNNEENFWPCVSDMFLAFFVIALALYANSNSEKGRGDEYISALARQEAVALMDSLHAEHAEHVQPLAVYERDEEDKKNSPLLAQRLYDLTQNSFLTQEYLNDVDNAESQYGPFANKDYNIRHAARLLYLCTMHLDSNDDSTELKSIDDPEYHQHLRTARERIERQIASKGEKMIPFHRYDILEKENERMKKKLASLESLPSDCQTLMQEVANLNAKMQDYENLKHEKRIVDIMLQKTKENLETVKIENDELNQAINRDNRKSVMEKVEKLLKERYPSLYNSGIILMMDEGVIRIPESVVGFDSAKWRPRDRNMVNVNQLSDALGEIAEMVKYDSLQIDNISLECHADPTGSRFGTLEIELPRGTDRLSIDNDWLSMMRAMSVWDCMEQRRDGKPKLATFKNKAGLGLFSTSGFGARVPVTQEAGEDEKSFHARCRRLDIRLNCSPEKNVLQ